MKFGPGPRNPRWRGGCKKTSHGYIQYLRGGRYEYEHRLRMGLRLRRKLRPDEIVHHLDGDRTNNNEDNLVIVSRAEHSRLHASKQRRDSRGRFARQDHI